MPDGANGGHTPVAVLGGAGHLGRSIVAALVAGGIAPERIRITGRRSEPARAAAASLGVAAVDGNASAVAGAGVVIVAVPPSAVPVTLAGAAGAPVVLSFVAGLSLDSLRVQWPATVYARGATNAAALGAGGLIAVSLVDASGAVCGRHASPELAEVLAALGDCVEVAERFQDLAAVVLGSGAAFVARTAHALGSAGVDAGLDADLAARFAAAATSAAAWLLADADRAEPWRALATPGGLTEAGLRALDAGGAAPAMAAAVTAALNRFDRLAGAGWDPAAWSKRALVAVVEGVDAAARAAAVHRLVAALRAGGHDVGWRRPRPLGPLSDALDRLADQERAADSEQPLRRDVAQLVSTVGAWRELMELRSLVETPGTVVVVDTYSYALLAAIGVAGADTESLARRLIASLPDPDIVYYLDASAPSDLDRAYRALPEFASFRVFGDSGGVGERLATDLSEWLAARPGETQ